MKSRTHPMRAAERTGAGYASFTWPRRRSLVNSLALLPVLVIACSDSTDRKAPRSQPLLACARESGCVGCTSCREVCLCAGQSESLCEQSCGPPGSGVSGGAAGSGGTSVAGASGTGTSAGASGGGASGAGGESGCSSWWPTPECSSGGSGGELGAGGQAGSTASGGAAGQGGAIGGRGGAGGDAGAAGGSSAGRGGSTAGAAGSGTAGVGGTAGASGTGTGGTSGTGTGGTGGASGSGGSSGASGSGGSGGTDGTGGTDGSNCANPMETIATNHPEPHTMTVSAADVTAGAEKTYNIMGQSLHSHSVTLTAAHFATLAGGGSVTVMSTSSGTPAHTHSVMVSCA